MFPEPWRQHRKPEVCELCGSAFVRDVGPCDKPGSPSPDPRRLQSSGPLTPRRALTRQRAGLCPAAFLSTRLCPCLSCCPASVYPLPRFLGPHAWIPVPMMNKILSLSFTLGIDINRVLCARCCFRCWGCSRSKIDETLCLGSIELTLQWGGGLLTASKHNP